MNRKDELLDSFFVTNQNVSHSYQHKRKSHKFSNEYPREEMETTQTKSY